MGELVWETHAPAARLREMLKGLEAQGYVRRTGLRALTGCHLLPVQPYPASGGPARAIWREEDKNVDDKQEAGDREMKLINVEVPVLVGSDEEIALGEQERWRCWGLIFCRGIERPYNSSWQEYVALVRGRARRALETEVQALYWVERKWRWDVFGYVPRHPFKTARWELGAAEKVEFRFEITEGDAGLWAAAAWAEGHEHLAEWVYGVVNGWICDLALVADRVQKDGEISRRDVVERLQELGEKAQKRGERSLAVVLHATALAIINGLETEVAERTVAVVCERALEHMEAHVRDVG